MNTTETVSVNELEQAFAVFNRVSNELDTTYRELEAKVAALTDELAAARSARLVELAEKEKLANRLSALVAALPGGVLLVDAGGIVRDANPVARSLLGDPLMGTPWAVVLERACQEQTLETRELLQLDGRRFSVSTRTLDDTGERVVLVTDVTQVHQLQEQLGRKKRLTALGEMAARLAHQIRTPLSSTTLYMAQLGRDDLLPAQRHDVARKVNDRLQHMGKLLESMLSFVRGAAPVTETLALRDVLQTFAQAMKPHFVRANSALHLPELDHTLTLNGDHSALTDVFSNLAMNALEVSGGDIVLEITACALSDRWLQIAVNDNGPGIEEEFLERVFDPFFTTRAAGTGLGLAVVANIITNHGGAISVSNRPEGGAQFLIEMPIGGSLDE